MGSFFGITFLNPWLLSALLILPVLYFLLRVMPPPPKSVVLATSYFLEGLTTQKRTTSKTPWWLLLLRILILTCIIFAFAHPISNKNTDFASDAPLLIVLDNSWAGASNWSDIIGKGKEILRIAEETAQPAAILLTTPLGGEAETIFRDFQDAGSIVAGFESCHSFSRECRGELPSWTALAEDALSALCWMPSLCILNCFDAEQCVDAMILCHCGVERHRCMYASSTLQRILSAANT